MFYCLPQIHPTDIPAFLKAEREEAILGLLEETKRETVESLTSRHWDCVVREWERDKARILSTSSRPGDTTLVTSALSHHELGTERASNDIVSCAEKYLE